MKRFFCLILCLSTVLFSGCATTATAQQRRNIEVKEIQGNFDTVYRSVMSVLQDRGYIIKHTDKAAGTIQAETGTKTGFLCQYEHAVTCNRRAFWKR